MRLRHLLVCALLCLPGLCVTVQAATVSGVQSGTLTVTSAGTTTVNINIVNPARSALLFSTRHASNTPGGSMLRGRLASANTLEFVSVSNATFGVQWYLIEFASGVQVQRGAINQSAATVNVAITPVASLAQAFVTWSKTPAAGDTALDADDPVLIDLTAVNNLQVRSGQAAPGHTIWWQVVEYTSAADIDVQRGSAALLGNNNHVDVNINSVDLGASFVLAGFRTSGSGSDIERRMVAAELKNASRVSFRRENDGDDIEEIGWQVVQFLDGTMVQSGVIHLRQSDLSRSHTVGAVDPTRALVFATAQAFAGQSLGRTNYNGDDIPGYGSATLSLTASQVVAQRAISGDHARIEWALIRFPAPPPLGGFAITVAASASTCAPTAVTVQALDSAGNPLPSYTGTMDLSTSTGNGNWSIASGSGTLIPNPDNDDDGSASYAFVGADAGVVTLNLANAHADDLTITVSDAIAAVSATSGVVSFRDNAFVITNTEFAHPVAGRDHAFTVALWQRDPGPPASDCQIAAGYNGTQALDGWYDASASHPPGAAAPALEQGGSMFTLGAGVGAAVPVSLDFVNGVAAVNLRTADVGQYAFNLRDDTGSFASAVISGASNVLTVRPFGFAITGIAAGAANPGGTAPGGAQFTAAGAQFRADFRAVLYQVGDPIDANGNPISWLALENNAAAPSFATLTDLGTTLNTPAAGVTGALDRPSGTQVAAGEFAAGVATVTDLRYAEVGSMFIETSSANYLGTAGLTVQGRSQAVGTFLPAEFTITPNAPTYDATCTAFTYYDQPFDYSAGARPQVIIDAVNALGAVTQNYFDFGGADDWWRLGDLAETYSDAGGAALAWSGTGASHNSSATPSGNGTVTVTFVGTLTYTKPLPYGGPGVAPIAAAPRLSFSLTDADGVQYDSGNPFVLAIVEAAGQDAVRHGRLRLESAHGSEVTNLAAPLTLQYFDGANFLVHSDDNCTAVAAGDFSYSAAPAAAGVTAFAGGTGSLDWTCSVAAPCPAGFVDVTGNLAGATLDWLRYDWDGDAVEDEPRARVTFGIHAGNRRQIHVRELY